MQTHAIHSHCNALSGACARHFCSAMQASGRIQILPIACLEFFLEKSTRRFARNLLLSVIALALGIPLFAQNPCAEPHARALVMGGGGSKGAFQTGAVYHLVAQRGCDFDEISGTSAGALNGSILAQAASSDDPAKSLDNMRRQADSLVALWESFKASKDIVRNRPLASIRFGLFGLEGMKDFRPLYKILQDRVQLERLEGGRELRVGTVSFNDGIYREIPLNPHGEVDTRTIDLLFGSAIIPMFGKMPRIPIENTSARSERVQFSDGSLRHTVPASSYFVTCSPDASTDASRPEECRAASNHGLAAHPRIEQLFVIATSPYHRDSTFRPVLERGYFNPGTHQITDGRLVMNRAIDVIMDTMHHTDLDMMLMSNDLLRWHASSSSGSDEPKADRFPLESYNYGADLRSRPYLIGLITPQREDGEVSAMLDFSPARIARQLYCGCIAADEMMAAQFGVESLANQCSATFHPHKSDRQNSPVTGFSPDVCVDPASIPPVPAVMTRSIVTRGIVVPAAVIAPGAH